MLWDVLDHPTFPLTHVFLSSLRLLKEDKSSALTALPCLVCMPILIPSSSFGPWDIPCRDLQPAVSSTSLQSSALGVRERGEQATCIYQLGLHDSTFGLNIQVFKLIIQFKPFRQIHGAMINSKVIVISVWFPLIIIQIHCS